MNKLINSHRSIRQYHPDPIDENLLNEILNSGLRGSSSGNMQTWSVVVTRDEQMKKKLYELHYQQEMILQAPVVLTFCSDVFRMREWIRVNQSKQSFDDFLGFLTGATDAIISAQNVALAAESEGLGICYMGTTWWSADKISELLELPECVFPVTSLVIGRPAENPEIRDRLPLESIVHQEKYKKLSDDEINKIHQQREKLAWERYQQNPELFKKMQALGIKKVTDFYSSEIKYSKELHLEKSKMLRELLKSKKLW